MFFVLGGDDAEGAVAAGDGLTVDAIGDEYGAFGELFGDFGEGEDDGVTVGGFGEEVIAEARAAHGVAELHAGFFEEVLHCDAFVFDFGFVFVCDSDGAAREGSEVGGAELCLFEADALDAECG